MAESARNAHRLRRRNVKGSVCRVIAGPSRWAASEAAAVTQSALSEPASKPPTLQLSRILPLRAASFSNATGNDDVMRERNSRRTLAAGDPADYDPRPGAESVQVCARRTDKKHSRSRPKVRTHVRNMFRSRRSLTARTFLPAKLSTADCSPLELFLCHTFEFSLLWFVC